MTPEDLTPMRESLKAYEQWRKAKGLPPSQFFAEKVRDGLVKLGFKQRRPAPLPKDPR